jgi:hypothetical protein
MAAGGARPTRGKSGLHEATVPGNARAGKPDGERHRNKTAAPVAVRMKRWGKSPPRPWQQGWHGKPHLEQCQIGPPRGPVSALVDTAARRASAERGRVGSSSRAAMRGLDEWSSKGATPEQNPAYRPSARSLDRDLPTRRGIARGQRRGLAGDVAKFGAGPGPHCFDVLNST